MPPGRRSANGGCGDIGPRYEQAIAARAALPPEELFFELAVEDLARIEKKTRQVR